MDFRSSDDKDDVVYEINEDELMDTDFPYEEDTNRITRSISEETLVASETEDMEDVDDYSHFYTVNELSRHGSRVIHSDVIDYIAKITNSEHLQGGRMIRRFERILESLLQNTLRGLKPNDYVRIVIQANGLKHPISIAYTKFRDYDIKNIFHHVERVLQSCESVRLDSSFVVNVARTYFPTPGKGRLCGGYKNRRVADFEKWIREKQCLISIDDQHEGLCGWVALVVAKAIADKVNFRIRQKIPWQFEQAQQLAMAVNLQLYNGLDIDAIRIVQNFLKDYQISIYEPGETEGDLNVLFRGDSREKNMNLLYYREHYWVIKSMQAMYGHKYYCNLCYKPYSRRYGHRCLEKCFFCQEPLCPNRSRQRTLFDFDCPRCGVAIRTYKCRAYHSQERCDSFAKCKICELSWPREKLDPPELHLCMNKYCRICRCVRPRFVEHTHFVPTITKKENEKGEENDEDISDSDESLDSVRAEFWETASAQSRASLEERKREEPVSTKREYAYIDFETAVCHGDRHYASILCILQWAETGEQHVFEGAQSASQFLDYILSLDYKRTCRTFLAHYSSGFDCFCFLRLIYERQLKVHLISRGQKLLNLSLMNGRISFVDSLMFLSMPLASFSSAFDIKETKKGFFPYTVLRCRGPDEDTNALIERLKRPIEFPSRENFDEGSMMPKRRKEFASFYTEASAYFSQREYVPWRELVSYCESDVTLLRLGCEHFRSLYKEIMQTDPFETGITLTSANFHAFKRNFLQKDKIAIISDQGMQKGLYSKMACVWLESVARDNCIYIQHAGNIGEKRIDIYNVDGYSIDPPVLTYRNRQWTKMPTVFQFHSCQFHGHPECQKERDAVFMGESMSVRYARTVRCEQFLRKKGYNVIVQWSCHFEPLLRACPALKEAAALAGALHPRLMPRDAYFGGRVEAFKLYHQCAPGETIRYFDFNGLYPTCMLTSEYYVGVPKVIRSNFEDVSRYRGLCYGRFLATKRDLFLPVLPCRLNNKICFTLCTTCSIEKNTAGCTHTDDERAITTIVTTEELMMAREFGYIVLELFEVWHYTEDQRDANVFTAFESLWMKVKAEASGWPASMENDPEAQRVYLDRYKEKFGIELDSIKIRKNVPMRTVAKLCGNALYGRLGLRSQRTNLCVATEFEHLRRLLVDPNVDVHDVYIINEKVSLITYTYIKDSAPCEAVNLVMCIQTTSLARCMLYRALNDVHNSPGCHVLYTDTDSIIFSCPDDFRAPFHCSEVLGDLKDEIVSDYGPNAKVTIFYCTGQKSYCYIITTPEGIKTVMKLKGFRLDYNTLQLITPETIKRMIELQDPEMKVCVPYPRRIVRSLKTGTMREADTEKRYRLTADKRVLLPGDDYISVPFGSSKLLD